MRINIMCLFVCLLVGAAPVALCQGAGIAQPVDAQVATLLDAAKRASHRDARVELLQQALTSRPSHRDNLAIEFKLAIELVQRTDKTTGTGVSFTEGLEVFEHIVATYKHMDYFETEPVMSSESMQFMVPAAAIQAATIGLFLKRDPAGPRAHLVYAMKCFDETHKRRVDAWSSVEVPKGRIGIVSAERQAIIDAEHDERVQELRGRAASGNVFSEIEMAYVKASVRQFAYTHSPQTPSEFHASMSEIVRTFPDTPMAMVAKASTPQAIALDDTANAPAAFAGAIPDTPSPVDDNLDTTATSAPPHSVANEATDRVQRVNIASSENTPGKSSHSVLFALLGLCILASAVAIVARCYAARLPSDG